MSSTTRARLSADPVLARKAGFFERFWEGRGPYPILFSKPHLAKEKNWLRRPIDEQHADPAAALEEALEQAKYTLLDIDDGIPVARADLGTTLFPSFLGLKVHIEPDVHPWLAEHRSLADYAALRDVASTVAAGETGALRTAAEFYRLLGARVASSGAPLPYLPDNQGIFDIGHIVVGTDFFYGLADDPDAVHAAQRNSLALYEWGTRYFKRLAGEEPGSMLHGHGMSSGVWFPDIGARVSEDSCTLISRRDIEEFCVPYLERAASDFGGLFLHFCGRHEDFLRLACGSAWARTLNLGNPELYDLDEVFRLCGERGTVYFGHLDPAPGEDDEAYLERLAEAAGRSRAGLILVAPPVPDAAEGGPEFAAVSADRCRRLRDRWHRLTAAFSFKRAP
jgi:hypothetical protein